MSKYCQDRQNLLQVDICNKSYKKKVKSSMKTYLGTNAAIYEIGQSIWVTDQAFKLIHGLAT